MVCDKMASFYAVRLESLPVALLRFKVSKDTDGFFCKTSTLLKFPAEDPPHTSISYIIGLNYFNKRATFYSRENNVTT